MKDIELVIKIPKEQYSLIMQSHRDGVARFVDKEAMMYAIKNGTPLPEHYGRLGDIDVLEEKILHIMEGDKRTFNNQITDDGLYYDGVYAVLKILKQAPAIIPATKEGD